MQNNNQHILHRVNLDITTNSEAQAFAIRKHIDEFLKEQLFPQIESLFDSTVSPDEIRRFGSLELSLHLKSIDDMNSVKDHLVSQLHEKIEFAASTMGKHAESRSMNLHSPDQKRNNENIFLNFLNTGQLPWFATPPAFRDYIESGKLLESFHDDSFIKRLKLQLFRHKQSISRFIQQFEYKYIEELIIQLSGVKEIEHQRFSFRVSGHDQWIKKSTYFLIISSLIHDDYSDSVKLFQDLISEIHAKSRSKSAATRKIKQVQELLSFLKLNLWAIHPDKNQKNTISQPQPPEVQDFPLNLNSSSESSLQSPDIRQKNGEQKQVIDNFSDEQQIAPDFNKIENKAVYIENAGLILVHPFLWDLFSRTKCTDEVNALPPDKKDLAVHILHYLATGHEQEMEYMLTFEKFLCGIPLDSPVSREILLSDQAKIECNDLLLSIIRFWPELKNTSPDGLRQMFLQRNGKLDLQKPPYKLYIERKAQDVLLEHLQWNISIVKLPWFQELLFTEW
ncbi:MAG: contractile injection system tape measure protein [Prolixibacteraceae bacterium]